MGGGGAQPSVVPKANTSKIKEKPVLAANTWVPQRVPAWVPQRDGLGAEEQRGTEDGGGPGCRDGSL